MGLELVTLEAEYVRGIRLRCGNRLMLVELDYARRLCRQLTEAIAEAEADDPRPTTPGLLAWEDTERPSDPYIEVDGEVAGRETIG